MNASFEELSDEMEKSETLLMVKDNTLTMGRFRRIDRKKKKTYIMKGNVAESVRVENPKRIFRVDRRRALRRPNPQTLELIAILKRENDMLRHQVGELRSEVAEVKEKNNELDELREYMESMMEKFEDLRKEVVKEPEL